MLYPPTVYPAAPNRLGLIERPSAADIVEFYAIIERLNSTTGVITNEPANTVSMENYDILIRLSEEACRRSLPLLAELPFHEGDAVLRANIEGQSDQA